MRPPATSILLPLLLLLLLLGFLIPVALTPPSQPPATLAPPSPAPVLALPSPEPAALTPPLIPEAEAWPPPLSLPDGSLELARPAPDQLAAVSAGSRSLLSSNARENGRVLLALWNGTLCSVDPRSRKKQWEVSTGSPLWYPEQDLPSNGDNDYNIFPGQDWSLYKHDSDVGTRKLYLTVEELEELVHRTPQVKGSVVTVGSKTTTVYYVDADSGELVPRDQDISSYLETNGSANLIIITRTDLSLNSSDIGKPLWSLNASRITAHETHMSTNTPRFAHSDNNDIYVLLLSPDAILINSEDEIMYDPRYVDDGKPSIDAPYGNSASLALPFDKSDQTESSDISQSYVNYTSLLHIYDENRNFSTPSNSYDGGFVKKPSPEMFPEAVFGNSTSLVSRYDEDTDSSTPQNSSVGAFAKELYWSMAMILSLLILIALAYPRLRKAIHSAKQLNVAGGQQSVIPKKRKTRKAGNVKTGSSISSHGRIKSSENGSVETNCDVDMQSDERYPLINLIGAGGASDGRWVGRLFVSNSEIGRGSNGTVVFEGVYDGRLVAVKRLLHAHHDIAFKEIQNLTASDHHPNIVRWYGVEQDLDFVYISLERCTCSLSDLIQLCSGSSAQPTLGDSVSNLECVKGIDKNLELWRETGFPSPQLLKLMRDVVSGLAHLHELGIIHRDLKPHNVLISNDRSLNAKLSDMGISKRLVEDMSSISHHATGSGSSGWQAPEQLLKGRQTRAVDLFSLGCILFFCITKGKHPFGNNFERDSNIVNNHVDLFLVDHIPEALDLLSQLLDADPKKRPTALEVLHHPFFWSSETRLSFLRDTSDRIELEDRENQSNLLKELESIAPVAFGGKWGEKLDAAFVTDMGRYRKYSYVSTRDLLRVIRNKLNHYRELAKELQEILGSVPDGFDKYFSSRFPNLLMEAYKVVSRHCREESGFKKYFSSSLV